MKRRQFLKAGGIIAFGLITASKREAVSFIKNISEVSRDFKKRIIETIQRLKHEGSNIVKKIMNGKKYVFDPFYHYPYDGGIEDKKTGCQLFFHAHRPNEYGHFHTFVTDEAGGLVHLVLISMNKEGEPIGLATVNRWVTGDKYVKADVLKKYAQSFFVDPNLYKDKRVVEFVNYIFKAFPEEINNLFDERDKWIKNYADKYFREPYEDRDFEVLSQVRVNLGLNN